MDKDDKKLEQFVDKIMEEATMESPSLDFTHNLMQRIEAEQQKEVFQYKPILSRQFLTILFLSFMGLLVYLGLQYGGQNGNGWFKDIQFQWRPNLENMWGWLEHYTVSDVTLYAILFFGFLFFAQVPWLKKHMDRSIGQPWKFE